MTRSLSALLAIGTALAALCMIFLHLGMMPLLNPDEGRNTSIALDMLQRGSWLIPSYNGLDYLDKPPFFFRLVALSLAAFGQNEFAARLPSALFASGILAMVFAFARREYDIKSALLSVIVIASAPLFFTFARYVIFDMTLAFFVCGAIFSGYLAEAPDQVSNRTRWYTLMAACMGLAMLVKGPVGFIVPALVIALFNRADGTQGALRRLFAGRQFLIMLGIFLPWFISTCIVHQDFFYYGAIKETILRYTTNEFHRHQPFYFYPPVVFATMLPWGLLLPRAFIVSWRDRALFSRADRLIVIWPLAVIAFFSLSQSKLPGYVLSAIVPLGILIARLLIGTRKRPLDFRWEMAAMLVLMAGLAGAFLFYAQHPQAVEARIHLKDKAFLDLLFPAAPPAAMFFAGNALLCALGIVRRDIRFGIGAFLLLALSIPVFWLSIFSAAEEHRADRALAAEISTLASGRNVACIQCFPPGLTFYLGTHIDILTGNNGREIQSNYIPFMLDTLKPWPEQIRPATELDRWMAGPRPATLLMSRTELLPLLQTIAAKQKLQVIRLADGQYWGIVLPSNRKEK